MSGFWLSRGSLLRPPPYPHVPALRYDGGSNPAVGHPTLAPGDWLTYGWNGSRTGDNSLEYTLSPANASKLRFEWNFSTGLGRVLVNATEGSLDVVGHYAYFGTWGGWLFELNTSNGSWVWNDSPARLHVKRYYIADCTVSSVAYPVEGITATPAYINSTNMIVADQTNLTDVNSANGTVWWNLNLSNTTNSSGYWRAKYLWSSPLVYNGSIYVGLASGCDNPLVEGMLVQVPLAGRFHLPTHVFRVVPLNDSGGSIWSSPAVDPATNTIWVTTGNPSSTTYLGKEQAIVALDASDISVVRGYFLQHSQCVVQGVDCDFGAGPTLFTAPNGQPMVVAMDKNGDVFAFNRSVFLTAPTNTTVTTADLAWKDNVGDFSQISPLAYGNSTLFVGAAALQQGTTTGYVRAIYPTNGTLRWTHTFPGGYVRAGVVYADGIVVDSMVWYNGSGSTLEVLDAGTGALLKSFGLNSAHVANSEPVISHGRIFFESSRGDFNGAGNVSELGLPFVATPTAAAGTWNTSRAWVDFNTTASGGVPNYDVLWSFPSNATPTSSTSQDPSVHFFPGNYSILFETEDAGWEYSNSSHLLVANYTPSSWGGVVHVASLAFGGPCPLWGCTGPAPTSYSFAVTASGGSAPYTFQWIFGDGTYSAAPDPTHIFAVQKLYAVTVTVTDSSGDRGQTTLYVWAG